MTIGERIKKARKNRNLSQVDLAKSVGITKQTLYKYETGIITNIPSDKIESIAQVLYTTPAYIMGWGNEIQQAKNIFPIEKKKFPLLGNIACGKPMFADEEHELYVETGTNIHADFCLRAQGDSMIGARILDGDIVFIRKQEIVDDGEIAVVLVEDEATLKRVYYDRASSTLQLVADNPKYKPLVYHGDTLNSIRILGKAVAFQSSIR